LGRRETGRMPAVHQSIVRDIGYYCRTGKHEPIGFRLDHYLAFVILHFGRP